MPRLCAAAAFAVAAAVPVQAADPQPYGVSFAATGERALDKALRETSDLEALRKSAPASPFALILRARQDARRLGEVLEGFGYYAGRVDIRIEDHSLDDGGLADVLEAMPASRDADVRVAIDTGPLYQFRRVVVDGELPDVGGDVLRLEPGAPAVAADALAARARLLAALQQSGHAFATVDLPVAWVDADEPAIDLHFPVSAGEQVKLGPIDVQGLMRTHAPIVRSRLKLQPDELYDPRRLDEARRALLALGVFSGVTVRTPAAADASGRLPVTFEVAERKRHAIRLNGEYSTDLGGNLGATRSDRNVSGNADQLNVTANAVNLGGSAARTLGYDAHVELVRPDAERVERTMRYSVAAIKQSLDAYDVQSVTLGAQRDQRFSQWWTGSAGVTLKRARIRQQGQEYLYTLFSLPVTGTYDNTRQSNPLLDPVRGMRVNLTVSPAESLDAPRRTFVTVQGTFATYFELSRGANAGRSVLALRALAGNSFGAGQFSLPPDQRFYGGGSATVRGYVYQSIGPTFEDTDKPAGGTTVAAATVEFRQRFGDNFGAAAFVDTGQVTATRQPFSGTWRVGFGVGLRYYTAIGPIRFDLAAPVNPPADAQKLQVYIGLGQAF